MQNQIDYQIKDLKTEALLDKRILNRGSDFAVWCINPFFTIRDDSHTFYLIYTKSNEKGDNLQSWWQMIGIEGDLTISQVEKKVKEAYFP